jgi:hypothetical protein
MNPQVELEAWRLLWQSQPGGEAAADLRERVARETRRKKVLLICPVLVTISIGGWTALRAIASARFEDVVLAIETWLFIVVIWVGALWLERGTWRPLGDTTAAFLDLSIRRCQSALAGVRFAGVVYIVQLAVILIWQLRYSPTGPALILSSWPLVVLGWLGVPAYVAFGVWFSRGKRGELRHLLNLRRQLREP